MQNYRIEIDGMGCAHCVKSVTEALNAIGADVRTCEIGRADVGFDGTESEIQTAISDRGFEVVSIAKV